MARPLYRVPASDKTMSDKKTKHSATNQLWGGRFGQGPAEIMAQINASISFDQRLYRQDIAGSKAHCDMLVACGILSAKDGAAIQQGLDQILGEFERGEITLDPALEEAAATLGASPMKVFWRVTFPLIQPGIAAGAIFSFVMSFDNIPVSIFLTDVRTNTIPIAIMSYLEYNFDPSIAAVSSMLIIGSLTLALLLERIFGLRRVMGM